MRLAAGGVVGAAAAMAGGSAFAAESDDVLHDYVPDSQDPDD